MNRREFMKQAGLLLAGVGAAVGGVLAIALVEPKTVWLATPEPTLSPGEAEAFGRDVMEGIAKGIRTDTDAWYRGFGPMKDTYRVATKVTSGVIERVTIVSREYLITQGVDWEPRTGDFCPAPLFGIFLDGDA